MKRFRTLGAAAIALAALCVPQGQSVRAETVRMTPANMEKAAFVLLRQGRAEPALALAEALLTQFPNDPTALLLKSKAERELARYPQAVKSARLSWNHSATDQDRYGAALAMAQGLASNGQRVRAQLWLRRAMEVAPNPVARRVAETDFAYVRSRSRLALHFDASIRPSSNVNNGTSADTLWFLGLPFTLSGDARALSGVQLGLGARLRYRLTETEVSKTDLRFGVHQQAVTLSKSAKAQAPGAKGSDYALSGVELGIDRYWKPNDQGEVVASLTLGKNWYGGDPMSRYGRVDLTYRHDLNNDLRLFGAVGAERQRRDDSAQRSATIQTLTFGAARTLANKDVLRLTLSARDSKSASSDIDHKAFEARLDWAKAAPVWKGHLSLGLSAELRDYDRSRYSANGRKDETFGADLNIAFDQIDYMGFIPVVKIEASKTQSNIGLYESTTKGIGLSIQSKF